MTHRNHHTVATEADIAWAEIVCRREYVNTYTREVEPLGHTVYRAFVGGEPWRRTQPMIRCTNPELDRKVEIAVRRAVGHVTPDNWQREGEAA